MNNRLFYGTTSQRASALILVIMTLGLMVSIAVTFMNIVGRQKGNAVGVALKTHSDIALQNAQAHVIRSLVESAVHTENYTGLTVDYHTPRNPSFKKDFYPLVDKDGDPWTADDRLSRRPNGWTLKPTTNQTSAHPLVNMREPLYDMRGFSYNDVIARWYNVAWLTTDLKPIDISDSLTDAEKAKLKKSARYVVRYAGTVLDANGRLNINNNFPDVLSDGTTINRGSGPIDNLHYIRQQNYFKKYGRSIKSMSAVNGGRNRQGRSHYASFDPLDAESLGFAEDGSTSSTGLSGDKRLRMERGFRGGDLMFAKWPLGTGHKGRVYTWMHMSAVLMGTSDNGLPTHFSPYAEGMRDADLADIPTGEPVREVSTPWRVNLLTAPDNTLVSMMKGLSSEIKYSANKYFSTCNAHLFGPNYPEPFPLAFDAGRNHPLSREGSVSKGKMIWSTHKTAGVSGNFNSYILDVVTALSQSIYYGRLIWNKDRGDGNPEIGIRRDLEKSFDKGESYFNKMSTTNANDEMFEQILRETYRILGEHDVNQSVGSIESGSFLAGDVVKVGSNFNSYIHSKDPVIANAQIHPGDDSRAMEYVLNDIMISLFGKANPDASQFKVGDDVTNDAIALDFNQDGVAESTVTGWRDSTTGKKTWSWYWDGLGPYVRVSDENDYMKRPGWYRFVAGDYSGGVLTPYRKVGSKWVPVPDVSTFYEYNDLWLKARSSYPIKPFTYTGRLFIGKSKIFYGFIRGEVYDILRQSVAAASNRNFAYMLDPNDDRDVSDNTLLIQSEAQLIND